MTEPAIDILVREVPGWSDDGLLAALGLLTDHAAVRGLDGMHRLPVNGMSPQTVNAEAERPVRLGDDVLYRSRTGDYWLAAKVARTDRSSSTVALGRAKRHGIDLAILTASEVDLVVFSPGGAANSPHGTYFERTIPHDPTGQPGTWCWPSEVEDRP